MSNVISFEVRYSLSRSSRFVFRIGTVRFSVFGVGFGMMILVRVFNEGETRTVLFIVIIRTV